MMRRLITGLGLMVGTVLFAMAALAADAAQVDEIYHAKIEFFRSGTLIHSEELTGAGTMTAEVAVPVAGPLNTYRFTTVVQARSHNTTPGELDTPSLYAGSEAFTAALQLAQRLTVNDVDLAVYHPGADTCRATVWWTYYSVLDGSLSLDEDEPVTREARTAEINLSTPETPCFDDGSVAQYENILALIRAPKLLEPDPAATGPGLITPLDDFQSVAGPEAMQMPYPKRPDTRPLALYGDRIVRYDLSVLEDRTLYFVTLAFYKDDENIQTHSLSVIDQPLPVLFSSIYWYSLEELESGWPEQSDFTYPAQVNYLVRLRSQATGKLLSTGQCLEELPAKLADALHYFSFGGLRFEIYYPGADRVEACVSTQPIPGHLISQGPEELVPTLKSQPPGQVEALGCKVVSLATPLLGPLQLDGGIESSDLGVVASVSKLTVVKSAPAD